MNNTSKKTITFEFHQESGKRYRNKTISLSHAAVFGFSSGFYAEHSLYENTHVMIGYNKEDKAIGFRFIKINQREKKPDGAYRLSNEGTSSKTAALSFISKNNIDLQKYAKKYQPYKQNDSKQGQVFFILLDEKIEK